LTKRCCWLLAQRQSSLVYARKNFPIDRKHNRYADC
jgi:hypothetical protein